jgi:hypothetical protein
MRKLYIPSLFGLSLKIMITLCICIGSVLYTFGQAQYYIRFQNSEKAYQWLEGKEANKLQITQFRQAFPIKAFSEIYIFNSAAPIIELQKATSPATGCIYMERKMGYTKFGLPNDYDSLKQTYLKQTKAVNGWNDLPAGVATVAIIDDAFYINHPDLKDNLTVNMNEIQSNGKDDDGNGYIDDYMGYDVSDKDTNVSPKQFLEEYFNHGTQVAGVVAATTNNGLGIASVAYNQVQYIPIKAATDSDYTQLNAVEDAVAYALTRKPDVLNMSFGTSDTTGLSTLKILLQAAHDSGIVLVAASGNDFSNQLYYPAAFPHVISVGGVDKEDILSKYSQWGLGIDLMAPGDSIYTTSATNAGTYLYSTGTSFAAPLVAVAAALVKLKQPLYTTDQVELCLKNSCDNIDAYNQGKAGQLGAGRLNIQNALKCAANVTVSPLSARNELIYPNPSTGIFYIENKIEGIKYKIYDVSGRWLLDVNDGSFSMEAYPSGMYVIVGDRKHWLLVKN